MSRRTETRQREEEFEVSYCDICDARIGEAPIDKHGGYLVSTTIQASEDKRPLWFAMLCRDCIDDLRARSGFDAAGSGDGEPR